MFILYLVGEDPDYLEDELYGRLVQEGHRILELPIKMNYHVSNFPGISRLPGARYFDWPTVMPVGFLEDTPPDLCIYSEKYDLPEDANWSLWPFPTVTLKKNENWSEEWFEKFWGDALIIMENFVPPVIPKAQKS